MPRPVPLFALLLFTSIGAPRIRAQDFQTWNEIDFAATWNRIDWLVPALARVDTERPNPQLAATGIMADVHLPGKLTLTAGYLFVDLPPYSTQAHVPLIAVSELFKVGRVAISDRNRFERLFGLGDLGRHAGLGNSPVRYRNRLLFDLALGRTDRCHLFTDDEVFYDFEVSRWNQNRVQGGGGMRLGARLLLDIFFLQQNISVPSRQIQVVGSTFRVDLTARK